MPWIHCQKGCLNILMKSPFFNFFQAAAATDVKFYFYYMYMIGMSWSLINMIPYLIVIIYCWYRTRIPGLICACLR